MYLYWHNIARSLLAACCINIDIRTWNIEVYRILYTRMCVRLIITD